MKKTVILFGLLFSITAAGAQTPIPASHTRVQDVPLPSAPDYEYSEIARLSTEDYINLQLPPLRVLMENARNAPQVGFYESNREIEERELKTVRRSWLRYFKLNANYTYGYSDVYNQSLNENQSAITVISGRKQNYWNLGASFSMPLEDIFNRRNKIKQQQKRVENTQYNLDRWYDELRMKIVDTYTEAVECLSLLPNAAEGMAMSKAQYMISESDFINGKLDASGLARQKSIENSAIREYEETRSRLNSALLRLEILTNTKIINANPGVTPAQKK